MSGTPRTHQICDFQWPSILPLGRENTHKMHLLSHFLPFATKYKHFWDCERFPLPTIKLLISLRMMPRFPFLMPPVSSLQLKASPQLMTLTTLMMHLSSSLLITFIILMAWFLTLMHLVVQWFRPLHSSLEPKVSYVWKALSALYSSTRQLPVPSLQPTLHGIRLSSPSWYTGLNSRTTRTRIPHQYQR